MSKTLLSSFQEITPQRFIALDMMQDTENDSEYLHPKQIFQKLPIAVAQVRAGNISENVLNEIRHLIYFLH